MLCKLVATRTFLSLAASCALILALSGSALAQETGRKYALVVGVERYDPDVLNALRFAEDDVEELARLLAPLGYDVTTMTSHAPIPARVPNTAQKILDQLQRRTQNLEARDTLVVVLSGHGVQFTDDPPLADGSRESYFCPEEADLANRDTLVPISRVVQTVGARLAERKLLVVDACRNAPVADLTKAPKEIELEAVGRNLRTVPRGMLALFSCADQEKSFEDAELKHGVFSYHLMKYLKGDAGPYPRDQFSLVEMANYARRETSDFVFRKFNKDQSPVLVSASGLIDWPLGTKAPLPRLVTNSLGMKLTLIPAGEFDMGSPASEEGHTNDEQQHRVRITRPFYYGVYEVTVGEYRQFVNATYYRTEAERNGQGGYGWTGAKGGYPFGYKKEYNWNTWWTSQTDRYPVVNLNWNDLIAFCGWLSAKEGKTYRLPTEAEWEYACRGGTATRFHVGDGDATLQGVANIPDARLKGIWPECPWARSWDDGASMTGPVGRFRPNTFGLYDMHGNVWEWCSDWYGENYYRRSPPDDPRGPDAGTDRVIRGGGWDTYPLLCRCANRNWVQPTNIGSSAGFRVVCER